MSIFDSRPAPKDMATAIVKEHGTGLTRKQRAALRKAIADALEAYGEDEREREADSWIESNRDGYYDS